MASTVGNSIPLTGNPLIDGLVQGGSWQFSGPRTLTFSLSIWDPADGVGGGAWTVELADAMRAALTTWSDVADITFQELGSGTIYKQSAADFAVTLTGLQLGPRAVGRGYFPGVHWAVEDDLTYPRPEGDIFFDNFEWNFQYLAPGGAGFQVMLHEIAHALGLKHATDDGGNGRPTFSQLGISDYNSKIYTVLSNEFPVLYPQFGGAPATPMPLDILAIQHIYGANMSFHAGDDTYNLAGDVRLWTIWDAGGVDTVDGSSLSAGAAIDLRPGAMTTYRADLYLAFQITAIAYNVTIENALGSPFNDTIIGNDAANVLDGRGGDDILKGGLGGDIYIFNLGYGWDTIEDYDPTSTTTDTLILGSGILPSNVHVLRQDNDLLLRIDGNTADQIKLSQFEVAGYKIDQVQFADSTVWDPAALESRISHVGHSPVITAGPVSLYLLHSVTLDSMFSVSDPDGDPIVAYAFRDPLDGAVGTISLYNGLRLTNSDIAISPADLPNAIYVAGPHIATETLQVRATDGYDWSPWANINVSVVVDPTLVNHAPVLTNLDGAPVYVKGGAPVVLDSSVHVFDVEATVVGGLMYENASLTLSRHGGANAEDIFSASGNLNALSGNLLSLSGNILGFVMANSAGTLTLTFISGTTQMQVDETLSSIAYANSSDAPPATVQIDWTFSDGNYTGEQGSGGVLTGAGSTTVSILNTATPVLVYDWKLHTLLDGVSVTAGTTTHSTNTGGSAHFNALTDPSIALTASRDVPASEAALTSQAVNLQDAIAILKMIVGLDVNGPGKPLSPYQSLAADYNGDGTIGLTDAIGVLKHVIGLPAPDPVWKFVNEVDSGIPGKVDLNPGTLPATINADVSGAAAQVHVGLVGILIGDVDGSFAGAAGAQDLDVIQPAYFTDLTSAHGLLLSQFGVYG